jgi:hypothetical protein
MIATCIIEVSLALYSLIRYRNSKVRNIVLALLLLLALFQLAEYFVCGGLGVSALVWSRVGYVAITLLPPLGVSLVATISGRSHRLAQIIPYTAAAALVALFAVAPVGINSEICAGNYVIFHLQGLDSAWYWIYYYASILIALMLAAGAIESVKDRPSQKALRWFIIGVLGFLVPTATVNAINPKTLAGIPSIMCGFAVLFALVLALRVLPLTAPTNDHQPASKPS